MLTIYPFQKFAASLIFFLRKKDIRASTPRFIVVTGTSGKTLTRSTVSYSLKKLGYPIISPTQSYTNELGIVLAALGIESFSFRSLTSYTRLFKSKLQPQSFVCIEIGADFRSDIPWFLKHFEPQTVFITAIDPIAWTDSYQQTINDRTRLIESVPANGIIIYEEDNDVAQQTIIKAPPQSIVLHCPPQKQDLSLVPNKTIDVTTARNRRFSFEFDAQLFEPYRRALALTVSYLETLGVNDLPPGFFEGYRLPPQRLEVRTTPNGTLIVADTYKAVPLCTKWFLEFANRIRSEHKMLILSDMRPSPYDECYEQIIPLLSGFEQVFFVGTERVFDIINREMPHVIYLGERDYHKWLKKQIASMGKSETLFIKSADYYKLDQIVP